MGDYLVFSPNKNTGMLWRYFAPILQNNFATAGLIAGLYLRSGCDPYTGYENYIAEDAPELKDFAYDKKGFGIGKWKHWTRKQSLYNFCKKAGTPIFDISTQADFIMDEFSGTTYGPIWEKLLDVVSVKEAAYLVYDKYMDIKRNSDKKREICAELAMNIYNEYGEPNELKVPVKYVVQTGKNSVRVKGQKGKRLPFIRKTLGYLKPEELYRFIMVNDNGSEYTIYYNGEFGYVNAEKVCILTRMEAVK